MVKTCCVFKCSNAFKKGGSVSFFRFPRDKRQRRAWVKAVNREGWVPGEHSWICSDHFIDGWHGYDPDDDNYAPTIFSYKETVPSHTDLSRQERFNARQQSKDTLEKAVWEKTVQEARYASSLAMHDAYCDQEVPNIPEDVDTEPTKLLHDVNITSFTNTGSQCNPDPLLEENQQLKEQLRALGDVAKARCSVNLIQGNDGLTRFYTGLPTFAVFFWLYNFLWSKASRMTYWRGDSTTSNTDRTRISTPMLQPIDQLFAVLMRLRLGLFVQDVAQRFCISSSTFSSYFTTWISLLHFELKQINPFPSREIIDRNMPSCFKSKYSNTRIILDCTELYIQRFSSLSNQSMSFSNYKHHNTIKFLVGISPSGVITYVSEAWGGKASDRKITESSGLLDLLDKHDSVMADKGFTIADLLEKYNCHLNIPPFKGSTDQFSTENVFKTQEIAQLRIHVERSIGRVKNYHILNGVIPITLAPLASKMFQICCWLTNLDLPLVDNKS